MLVVDVLAFFATVATEPHQSLLFIDVDDAAGAEATTGDRVFQRAVGVVEVVVTPAAALRPPDHLVAIIEVTQALRHHTSLLKALGEQHLEVTGFGIDDAILDVANQAVATHDAQFTVFHPAQVDVALVLPLRLQAHHLASLALEHHQLAVTHVVLARHRVLVLLQRRARLA